VKAVVIEEIALQLRTRAVARGVVLDLKARAIVRVVAVLRPVAHLGVNMCARTRTSALNSYEVSVSHCVLVCV
jgi:hypothetical protein